jgi:hypothetical protein
MACLLGNEPPYIGAQRRSREIEVLGEQPEKPIEKKLQKILAAGESTALPPDVLKLLQERREQAKQQREWFEGHCWPGKTL